MLILSDPLKTMHGRAALTSLWIRTCAIGALRIHYIVSMDCSGPTCLAVQPSVYPKLEPTIPITFACVPLLRPLFGGKYS